MVDRKALYLLQFAFCLYAVSCAPDAPRSNPLDPELNQTETYARISGQVFSRYQPVRPLENARVLLLPSNEIRSSNSNGFFEFSKLDTGNYRLVAEKEGYLADTLTVSITEQQDHGEANFFLDALPKMTRLSFYSEHIDQWWPGEVYHAFFTVVVEDPDGVTDIDSLAYLIPSLNFVKSLEPTGQPDSFFVDVENFDLPGGTLQPLIENESYIFLKDGPGGRVTEGPFFLHRIIEEAPVPKSPIQLQTVSPSPNLEWQPFNLTFEFNFVVQVFRINAGIPVLIHTSPSLPAGQSSYAYPGTLSSGSYYWTIGVRDRLNNFSRSKEASFIVP